MIPMVALFLLPAFGGQVDEQDTRVRGAVTRSLNFLERNGTEWMEKRGCVSCHTVGMMVWTHNEARRRGFTVPNEKARAWTDWALVNLLARGKESGGGDTISQVILARDPADPWRRKPALGSKSADPYEALWESLLDHQRPDGSWKPGPQLASPAEVSTRWALLAIDSRDSSADMNPQGPLAELVKKIEARIPESGKLAHNWFKETPPDDGLEARILRMLMMRKQEPALAQIWLLELLELQNADGGWAYQSGVKESDAFATGLALYAMGVQGHPRDHAQTRKARDYLLKSMREDGSWRVKTANIRHVPEGKETAGADAIYSYWGTAWATLGLLWTLPSS
jgi:squalene-hopene/tetraprenyl-beta-curcumene cyclase